MTSTQDLPDDRQQLMDRLIWIAAGLVTERLKLLVRMAEAVKDFQRAPAGHTEEKVACATSK